MITNFKNEYYFLSNFYPIDVFYKGNWYPSSQNAYMSEKSIELSWKRECQTNKNPKVIKQKSKSLLLVDNWEQIKLSVMKQVIECKFRFPSDNKHVLLLNKLLIQTGEEDIYEYNYWGDTFWGIDSKTLKGENHLGKILMKRRQELKILMNEFYTRNKEIFNNK